MDNKIPLQSETDSSGTASAVERRFKDAAHLTPPNEAWHADPHAETSTEKHVRRTLWQIQMIIGLIVAACALVLFVIGLTVYRRATSVDPIQPDYSLLDTESDTYWTDRTLIDIDTAQRSEGTDELRFQRLRTFVYQTVGGAMEIQSLHSRAQVVTDIALVLAQRDMNVVLDRQLKRLGDTSLIASLRARVLISQALMHLRQKRAPAAQVSIQQYRQLISDADLKLNSSINEEAFFGAVTVLWLLGDKDGLRELFIHQSASATVVGLDQQMRAYRLIAGEQVRAGMIAEALETAKRISNHVELARAWALILQYSARPPIILPVEPAMLDLLDNPQAESRIYPVFAERAAAEIFQYLAENKDTNTQVALLQRIAGSRLMFDQELHKIFRQCLVDSEVLDHWVKQSVLKLLDNPESSAIREALNMPPRTASVDRQDPVLDDWTKTGEIVHVEIVDIDPSPLRARIDQQWIQALLAIAQGYQSIRRFDDADRVLEQAFAAVQGFENSNIRIPLLQRIGEHQTTIGSIADAKRTFTAMAPGLNQTQKGELARLQILARLFDDALATISSIESPENREYACAFLLQEQIRLNHLDHAERTLSLMPQGRVAAEAKSRFNVARERANREDFIALGLPFSEGNPNWEQHCIGLIQQGCLRLADQTADRIGEAQKRAEIRTRIAHEYLLLYQAFNDVNDPNHTIRQEIGQEIVSAASRTGQPATQTAILTELLAYLAGQLRTEEDRADSKRLWLSAMDIYRRITEPSEKATLYARLIGVKNMLDNPDLAKRALPLFTKETHPAIYEENNRLIVECLELVNSLEREEQRVHACVHLSRASAQIGRMGAAQVLLDHALGIATNISDREEAVSILLSMVPVLRAMNSGDTIPVVYRLAIDKIAHEFTSRSVRVSEFEWRMRDSEIERIIRSQMENGFVDDAVESASRLNEPLLRDRLLRSAVYIYLDHNDFARADAAALRITAREIHNNVIQNIQIIKRHGMERNVRGFSFGH